MHRVTLVAPASLPDFTRPTAQGHSEGTGRLAARAGSELVVAGRNRPASEYSDRFVEGCARNDKG